MKKNNSVLILIAVGLFSYTAKAASKLVIANISLTKADSLHAGKFFFINTHINLMFNNNPKKDTLSEKNSISENAFYGEGWGVGGLFSLNYERAVSKNYSSTTYIRNGVGIAQTVDGIDRYNDPSFLFAVINTTGIKKHHWETGAGFTIVSFWGDLYLNFIGGYRFQKPNGGLLFRANINVKYNTYESLLAFVPSISLGCAF